MPRGARLDAPGTRHHVMPSASPASPPFQNPYKSIVCEENPYFRELVHYIHLNPLRAGHVKGMETLDRYPWCGHSAIMGKVKRGWQDAGYALR